MLTLLDILDELCIVGTFSIIGRQAKLVDDKVYIKVLKDDELPEFDWIVLRWRYEFKKNGLIEEPVGDMQDSDKMKMLRIIKTKINVPILFMDLSSLGTRCLGELKRSELDALRNLLVYIYRERERIGLMN